MVSWGIVEFFTSKHKNTNWSFLLNLKKKENREVQNIVECQPLRVDEGSEFADNNLISFKKSEPETGRVILACILFILSGTLGCLMWFTDVYDNSILKLVSIRNDIDVVFDLWRNPPTRPLLSIYIFNYTNVEEVLKGNEKPKVSEVGPYIFREQTERINIQFHDNNTVSFQEKKEIEFLPEFSSGPLSDVIRVPNILLLSALTKANKMYFLGQKVVSTLVHNVGVEQFQNITVNDFIWGIDDTFYRLLKTLLRGDAPPKFGFLARRRGVHHHVVEMRTGFPELGRVGEITSVDGASRQGLWGDTPCDRLDGSDGSLFPGNKAYSHHPLFVFSPDMCRRIPLRFNKTTKSVDGFPVLRYNIPETLFDFSGKTEENLCYKYQGTYPPNGVFYTGPCQKGAPTYASFPHLWKTEEKLSQMIQGLKPDAERHRSSFLIHERLGICLHAQTRFQLNIRVERATYIPLYSKIENGTILPVAWMEYDSGPLPEHFVNVIYHLTYTVRIVQHFLEWIAVVLVGLSSYFMYKTFKRNYIYL